MGIEYLIFTNLSSRLSIRSICFFLQNTAHHIKKILLIRFSSIGDIVLTSPVIRCLKQQIPCELHFLTKYQYAAILTPNPYLEKVYTIQHKVGEVIADLKKERYDYIIDLHKNIRSQQVKLALPAKSFSFDKLNFEKWLITNFKINKLPAIHIVDRYLATTESLGIKNDGLGLDYFIPTNETINPSDIDDRLQKHQYILFAIGATHATKRLPLPKLVEICKKIARPIVLIGGNTEQKVGQLLKKQCPQHIINTCGQLSLHQSASLVAQARIVLTHDTGMMHIAAAFHKPIISIWGNTIPAFGMYPYYGNHPDKNTTIEVKDLSCRPCSKIGFEKCPKGHHNCMNFVGINKIVTAVFQQL